jgi:hypothetical protein
MKLSHVYIFNTIVAIVYALGLLIVPATIMTMHGIGSDPSALLMARYFGVGLLGIGLVTWLARNSDKSQAQDAISLGFMISYVIGFVVSLQATLAGQMNAVGWLPVVIYLLLIAGLGYFRFR